MAQPKADEKIVNAPTLSDDDLFDDLFDEEDSDTPPDANQEITELNAKLESQEEIMKGLAAQNKAILASVAEKKEQPKENTIPQQPADYDETAAYNDPSSTSFKWRVKAEQAVAEQERKSFIADIASIVDEKLKTHDQVSKIEEMEKKLIKDKNLTHEQLIDFREFLTTNKALDMSDLYTVYAKKKGLQVETDTTSKVVTPDASNFAAAVSSPDDDDFAFEKNIVRMIKGSIKY